MKRSKSKLQTVCLAVLGAALCVALSMAAKIQLGGHIKCTFYGVDTPDFETASDDELVALLGIGGA